MRGRGEIGREVGTGRRSAPGRGALADLDSRMLAGGVVPPRQPRAGVVVVSPSPAVGSVRICPWGWRQRRYPADRGEQISQTRSCRAECSHARWSLALGSGGLAQELLAVELL